MVDDLIPEVEMTRQVVLIDMMKNRFERIVSLPAERVTLFVEPRYKQYNEEVCWNKGQVLKAEYVAEINGGVAESYVCTAKFSPLSSRSTLPDRRHNPSAACLKEF